MKPPAERVAHRLNVATREQIVDHLALCDGSFVPPLSQRIQISDYAAKLTAHAMRFEAWHDGILIGLVAAYPDHPRMFVTNVSVLPQWRGHGVAAELMASCGNAARDLSLETVELEVDAVNTAARRLYDRLGFVVVTDRYDNNPELKMVLTLADHG